MMGKHYDIWAVNLELLREVVIPPHRHSTQQTRNVSHIPITLPLEIRQNFYDALWRNNVILVAQWFSDSI
jgi:hypothetical protein